MAQTFKVIGKTDHHDQHAYMLLTGKLEYAADNMPGKKLFSRILGSPYAHAKIKSIDTSKAEALPGVEAVVTYKDCPSFSQELRHWGQEVAAVAAVDDATAARATRLIEVQYDVIPFVTDPDEAAKPGAPLTGVFADTNMSNVSTFTRGDVNAGLQQADVVLETSVGWTNWFQVIAMEPHSCVAQWIGDHLYLSCASQALFGLRSYVAGYLKHPLHKVHVVVRGTGGAFGDKILNFEHYVMAAALAKKAAKPVLVHLTRQECFLNRGTHYASKIKSIKVGAKNDGTLTAISGDLVTDGLVSGTNGSGCWNPLKYTFKCANEKLTAVGAATNKVRTTAWRGPPDHSGSYLHNVVMTRLADKLNMDPLQLLLKTIVTADTLDQDAKKPMASCSIKETLEGLANAIGWAQKWHKPGTKTLPDGRLHGIGIHAHVSSFGQIAGKCGAIVNMTGDGKAILNMGQSRSGSGDQTAIPHIVAEKIGLLWEDVYAEWGRTDYSQDGGYEGGSTRVITEGAAFYKAAESCRAQIFDVAAQMLGVKPEDLDAADSKVFIKADPTKFKTHAEVLAKDPIISAVGYSWGAVLQRPYLGFKAGDPCVVRTMPGCAAEVAVDPETGKVEILNWVGSMDVGTAIWRTGCEKHVEGGMEVQAQEVLYWENIVDHSMGAIINANLIDNKVRTSLDLPAPDKYKTIVIESDDACGPYGAKGLGEPVVLPMGAISQAVYNAIGVWVDTLPITPIKILQALGKG